MMRRIAIREERPGLILIARDLTPHRIPMDEVHALRKRGMRWRLIADRLGRKGGIAFQPASLAQAYSKWRKTFGQEAPFSKQDAKA